MSVPHGETRSPVVAGAFYPAGTGALRRKVASCFTHRIGPGGMPQPPASRFTGTIGLVVPHAGIDYSGPVAAHAYARLAAMGTPRRIIFLGPDHFGEGGGASIGPWRHWRTPLGDLPVDLDASEQLRARCPRLRWDPAAHATEHAIEVQLPFLHHLFGESVPLVPISMTDQSLRVSEAIAQAMGPMLGEGATAVIASSDLSHYLPDEQARRTDRHALAAIESLDAAKLDDAVRRDGLNMCGFGPVAVMLLALRDQGSARAEVLSYATSGDTSGRREWVVGYTAAVASA